MLYIHPDECVDCGACEPVCPVEAIYYEDDVPEEWSEYTQANVDFFKDIGSPAARPRWARSTTTSTHRKSATAAARRVRAGATARFSLGPVGRCEGTGIAGTGGMVDLSVGTPVDPTRDCPHCTRGRSRRSWLPYGPRNRCGAGRRHRLAVPKAGVDASPADVLPLIGDQGVCRLAADTAGSGLRRCRGLACGRLSHLRRGCTDRGLSHGGRRTTRSSHVVELTGEPDRGGDVGGTTAGRGRLSSQTGDRRRQRRVLHRTWMGCPTRIDPAPRCVRR